MFIVGVIRVSYLLVIRVSMYFSYLLVIRCKVLWIDFFFYVMLGCQGVVKLVFQGNPNVYSLFVQQIENPRFRFGSPLI